MPKRNATQQVKRWWQTIKPTCLFLQNLMLHPRQVGAIWPSSTWLAETIAKQVVADKNHYIVELGAGTGVITDALLKKGIPADKLIAIEYEPHFVKMLKEKFPGV